MKLVSVLIFSLLLTVTAGFISCKTMDSSAGVLLKFNLEKGKNYDYEMNWDMDQKVMGQDTKMKMGGIYNLQVTEADDNIKLLTGKYKRFKMYMKMMGMEIEVDSDKPQRSVHQEGDGLVWDPQYMMSVAFNNIIDKPFTMRVDNEGKLLEVTGFDETMQSVIDSMQVDEQTKQMVMASVKDQVSDESLKDMFGPAFNVYPNKTVKVGDSWDKVFTTRGKMAAKFTSKFTLEEIKGDQAILSSKTTIDPVENSELATSGTQTATMTVDIKTGLLITSVIDQELHMTMNGVTIDMKGKGSVKGKAN